MTNIRYVSSPFSLYSFIFCWYVVYFYNIFLLQDEKFSYLLVWCKYFFYGQLLVFYSTLRNTYLFQADHVQDKLQPHMYLQL